MSMYTYRAHVKSVYDGDTITVDIDCGFSIQLTNQKIRLLGINTPEVRGEERERGLVSRDRLRERIEGKWVTLKTEKDGKGKFGRWLGTIWLDDENINEWLLAEGLAEVYDK